LAESLLKVSQMLVLNHFHVLSPLFDVGASASFTNRSCHVIRRSSLIGGCITLERRTVQGIKRVRQNVGFVLADRAGYRAAPLG
jgi:hypothetical protein